MSDPVIEITDLFKNENLNFVIYDLAPILLSPEQLGDSLYMGEYTAKLKNLILINEYPEKDEFVPKVNYTLLGRSKTKNSNPSVDKYY